MWPGGDPARYLRRVAGELRLVFRAGDRYKATAIRRAQPEPATAQGQAATEDARHSGQPFFGGPASGEHFSDFGENLETGVV